MYRLTVFGLLGKPCVALEEGVQSNGTLRWKRVFEAVVKDEESPDCAACAVNLLMDIMPEIVLSWAVAEHPDEVSGI